VLLHVSRLHSHLRRRRLHTATGIRAQSPTKPWTGGSRAICTPSRMEPRALSAALTCIVNCGSLLSRGIGTPRPVIISRESLAGPGTDAHPNAPAMPLPCCFSSVPGNAGLLATWCTEAPSACKPNLTRSEAYKASERDACPYPRCPKSHPPGILSARTVPTTTELNKLTLTFQFYAPHECSGLCGAFCV
jgi:hypothetical protein